MVGNDPFDRCTPMLGLQEADSDDYKDVSRSVDIKTVKI